MYHPLRFAGGMTAYPGGGVDPRDGDIETAWAGPPPAQWAAAFGGDERTALALGHAEADGVDLPAAGVQRELVPQRLARLGRGRDLAEARGDRLERRRERRALLLGGRGGEGLVELRVGDGGIGRRVGGKRTDRRERECE